MAWFDAGVNLLDPRFDANEVISRALTAGVTKMCIISTHPNEWERAKQLYEAYPEYLCYTVGVHPHNAKDVTKHDLSRLKEAARAPGVVAIGECGLDFNRDFSPRAIQQSVFEAQLSIACQLQLPVYLHERDAFDVQVACLQAVIDVLPGGVAHCFTGNTAQVKAYLDMGLYIGITGWVCDDKRGGDLRKALTHIPLDKLVLETDAPYLFPKTLRPRKRNNEPAFLPHIGEQVGGVLTLDTDKLQSSSYANTCRLFSLK